MKVDHANDMLFKQLLGKNLRQVLKELGFPEVPPTVFDTEDILIFQQHMDKLPTSHQAATSQLVRSLHKGRVTAIHTLEDGKTRVAVDFEHLGHRCTIQLLHWREHWETTGTPSVLKSQKQLAVPITVTGLFVVAVGGLLLWNTGLFGNGLAAMSPEKAVQYVEEQGYIVLTPEEKNELVAVAEENGYEKAQQKLAKQEEQSDKQEEQAEQDDREPEDDQGEQEQKELTFTMKEGMTSKDLTSWLKQNELIDDELAFGKKLEDAGLATKVRPGKYTFSTDMSEEKIMQELQ